MIKNNNLASSLLNQVNCSLAPNCSDLYRQSCSRTPHTCGPCLPVALIGADGDSNERCFLSQQDLRRRAVSSQLKECVGRCSGHGRCQFFSLVDSKQLSSCFEGDPSCYARCQCEADYDLSEHCEVSNEETERKVLFREQAVSNLAQIMGLQEASEGNLQLWLGNMQEVAQIPSELSDSSLGSLLEMTSNALAVSREGGYGTDSLSLLPENLDRFSFALSLQQVQTSSGRRSLSSRRRLDRSSETNSLSFFEVLRNYSQLLADNLLPGQLPISISRSTVKIQAEYLDGAVDHSSSSSSSGVSGACRSNVSLSLPQTSLEAALQQPRSSVVLPTCFSASSKGVAVVSSSASLYGDRNFSSDPLSLYLTSLPCEDPEQCRVLLVLQSDNAEAPLHPPPSASNVSLSCRQGDRSNHTLTCPDGSSHSVSCPGETTTIIGQCPSHYPQPSCRGLLGLSQEDIDCQLVSFSSSNVTCSCPLLVSRSSLSSGRRVLAAGNSSDSEQQETSCHVDYVSMLGSVGGNFESTVLSAGGLSAGKVADSWVALVTTGSLLGAILVALLLSYYADERVEKKIGVETNMMMHALVSKNNQHQKVSRRLAPRQTISQRVSMLLGAKNRSAAPVPGKIESSAAKEGGSESVLALAEEALPRILSSQSTFLGRTWSEVKRRHRWFGIIFYFNSKFPRVLRVLSLSTNILIMLFVQSLTYNFTHGDDGTCERFHSRAGCLSLPSDYATSGHKCYWRSDQSVSSGSCHYLQPDDSVLVVMFVAIFSAFVSAPAAILADWIIQNVLAAPLLHQKSQAVKVVTAVDGFFQEEGAANAAGEGELGVVGKQFLSFERDILQQEKIQQRVLKEFAELKTALLAYRGQLQFDYEVKEFNGEATALVSCFCLSVPAH
jgi:hypothetical protein